MVLVDLSRPEIWLRATGPGENGQRTSSFAAATGALVAINGDMWDADNWSAYEPLGLAVGDGWQWRDDTDVWSFFACDPTKRCWFDPWGHLAVGSPRWFNAMNNDGGGSSTLVIAGSVQNTPSDGSERIVANHLGIMVSNHTDAACVGVENSRLCVDATQMRTCIGGIDRGLGDCAGYGLPCVAGLGTAWCWADFRQATPADSSLGTPAGGTLTLRAGEQPTVWFELSNTGLTPWQPGVTRIAPLPRDQPCPLAGPDWIAAHRAATLPAEVPPGGVGRFTFTLQPPGPGEYVVAFGLLDEGVTWFADPPSGGGPEDGTLHIRLIVTDDGEPLETDGGDKTDGGDTPAAGDGSPDAGDSTADAEGVPSEGGGCACRAGGTRNHWGLGLVFGLLWLEGMVLRGRTIRSSCARSSSAAPVRIRICPDSPSSASDAWVTRFTRIWRI